jgi:hypothetical protein
MPDADGQFTYSNVVPMRKLKCNKVKMWPNPFSSKLTFAYQSETALAIAISITDISGKMLITERFAV